MQPRGWTRGYFSSQVAVISSASVFMTACSESPSRNILGSYFPTWMLCALVGIAGVFVLRVVLVKTGVDAVMPVPVLVYLSLWIAVTLAVWLLWLG